MRRQFLVERRVQQLHQTLRCVENVVIRRAKNRQLLAIHGDQHLADSLLVSLVLGFSRLVHQCLGGTSASAKQGEGRQGEKCSAVDAIRHLGSGWRQSMGIGYESL
ncbi:hypothetical protein D3C81_1677380 [compost metagenome]